MMKMSKILVLAFVLALSAGALSVCAQEKPSLELSFLVGKEKIPIVNNLEISLDVLISNNIEVSFKGGAHLFMPLKRVSPNFWKKLSAKANKEKEEDKETATVDIKEYFTGPSTIVLTPIKGIEKKLKFVDGKAKTQITVIHDNAISERVTITVLEPPK